MSVTDPLVPASFPMGRRCCAVRSQRNREAQAEQAVMALGFPTFRPIEQYLIRHQSMIRERIRTLIPQHFFVWIDLERDDWRPINHTRWVDHILCNNEIPCRCEDDKIAALMQAQEDGIFDRTKKGQVSAETFEPGETVRIKEGPFASFLAKIVESKPHQRYEILTELFGRTSHVDIDALHLEKI